MKAILINEHGNENVLYEAELEIPNISHNEVLIEMKTFSLNPSDVVNREGLHGALAFPHMLGRDFVGLVKEVGASCQSIQIGDLVTGISFEGTYAEYIKMDEQAVIKIPQEANIKEVAAFPVVAITAWAALLDYGFIQSNHNQKVLIHAGAGGVGHIAIQIAKQAGAYVYTTASKRNTAFLKSLGADEVINYKTTDFTMVAKEIDVVIDTIGGNVQNKSFQVLKKGGRLISVNSLPNQDLAEKYGVISQFVYGNMDKLSDLVKAFIHGQFVIHIEKEYSFTLDEVRQAQVDLSQGHSRGKRIVTI